jgi:hypothetical protein
MATKAQLATYARRRRRENERALAELRKMLKQPKTSFTSGDFQRAHADKFVKMFNGMVKEREMAEPIELA